MKKSIRNLVLGAVMAIGVFGASSSVFAYTQYVQTDMNFRNGPSMTAAIIGSVPEGAKVDVIKSRNGWDLVTYNGRTGYIHGGNMADSYKAPAKNSTTAKTGTSTNTSTNTGSTGANMNTASYTNTSMNTGSTGANINTGSYTGTVTNYNTTQNYYDNNSSFSQAAEEAEEYGEIWMMVYVTDGYLALRDAPYYDVANEIGALFTGDIVQVIDTDPVESYVLVYSPKYDEYGFVNAGFLV